MHPHFGQVPGQASAINVICIRGRRGFWRTADRVFSVGNLDLEELLFRQVQIDILIGRHRQKADWGSNMVAVQPGDHIVNVMCTMVNGTANLAVRVLPGQVVTLYYQAPRTRKAMGYLGFAQPT